MQTVNPTTASTSTRLDHMLTPMTVMRELVVDEAELLAMVNSGVLAAYDFDGHIRFAALDVAKLIGLRAVA